MNVTLGQYQDPAQGQQMSQLGSGAGSIGGFVLGNMVAPGVGGPIGSAIGGAAGGALGGLLGGGKKKKQQVKIFPLGSKENPGWPGFGGGGGPRVMEQAPQGPSALGSGIAGGASGLLSGMSLGNMLGSGGGGITNTPGFSGQAAGMGTGGFNDQFANEMFRNAGMTL